MRASEGVCVVITAYRAETTIARAVTSALSDTRVREVIVVDDHSPDGTIPAAKSAAHGSERLQVIAFDRNRGPSAARNAAIAGAESPLVAILDADDYFLPDRFSQLPDGDWDFVADNIAFIPEGSTPPDLTSRSGECRHRDLSFDEFIERNISRAASHRSELGFLKPVMRRATLQKLGLVYDEKLRLGEDFILYATALARGAHFVLSECCGYVAEVRATSLSGLHRTEDLAALAEADRALVAELERAAAPPTHIRLLRRHLRALDQKVATRRFIDRKHVVGLARATLELTATPAKLVRAAREIVDGKLRHRRPQPLPAVRMLLVSDEFAPRLPS